jgi:energy-coupling factor transporter ATP-binding protein EcfA2
MVKNESNLIENQNPEVFKHGSAWLRVDFHLHTRKDKEFEYTGDESHFLNLYVEGLKKSDIRIGLISNHNKFDLEEFRSLRKKALKEEIYLLPGLELSVKDGSSGIHVLAIFSDEWAFNPENKNYIQSFIDVTFAGQSNFDNKNSRSNHDLLETIRELSKFGKDYFFIFAHVEEENGLWGGLSGGRIEELRDNELFCRRTLGFQKVRTRSERTKVQGWLKDWYPAEVEGSDCKSIEDIGKGEKCFLKIGAFTFEAVKYALLDFPNRVSNTPKKHERSIIISMSFEGGGGTLDGKTIYLSPEMNTLIGIRGSGKSSILESLRYALDIPFGDKTTDLEYKKSLLRHTLGSGGKVTVWAMDQRGQKYEIRRIYQERPDVYIEGNVQPGISIRETVVQKPIYFGQKDLSSTGEGFERDLVEKLVGEKLVGIRTQIEEQRQRVIEAVEKLEKLSQIEEKKNECEQKKQDAEFRLKFYKEHGVEEKLQKQVDFDADNRKCSQVVKFVKEYLSDLESLINRYEDDIKNNKVYSSRQNAKFFTRFFKIYDRVIDNFAVIKKALDESQKALLELNAGKNEFEELRSSLKEEFAEIERKLAAQLKDAGAKAIRPDEFRQLRNTVEQSKQMLEVLNKQQSQQIELRNNLLTQISSLNTLWNDEYNIILGELNKVNQNQSALSIKAEFKGDKDDFFSFTKDVFRGSRIRETIFKSLVEEFVDFGVLYRESDRAKEIVGSLSTTFEEYFYNNLAALLTWQVPNRFAIEYRGKELKHHSLGQRASALILFVLSQRENDIIIIDQPEDDLDNQTIYEDVIKLVRSLKPDTQFIFATHNANFPVLGDAEQIIACQYADDMINMRSGSIDCPQMQKQIVDIMEGGEEAFKQRKRIYEIWKPHNS